MTKRLVSAFACCLVLCLCACSARRPPDLHRDQDMARLRTAFPKNSEHDRAARFLLDNLPLADRLSMTEAQLRENLDYAFLARKTMPWGARVPWDVFLRYVVPHRTSQEPFHPHRAMLYHELAPLCRSAASMEDALSKISAWTMERVHYTPTSRRDLGVRAILDGGYGRCEELNILYIAAARSVGLPVRQALTPWWRHADGNHAWVEVWTENGWRFLETSAFFSRLNRAWFSPDISRMAKVAAHVYGPDPGAYRQGLGFSLVDSTGSYVPTTTVRVQMTDAHGSPSPDHAIFFSIYSLGGLRPVTMARTSGQGKATATLGPGVFLVSYRNDHGLGWTLMDTTGLTETTLTLSTSKPTPLPRELLFPVPARAPAVDIDTPDPAIDARRQARNIRFHPLLSGLPQNLAVHLRQAGQRIPEWLRVLSRPAPSPWLEPLVLELDAKDLLQADPEAVAASIPQALRARRRAVESGLRYDHDLFLRYVLAPRIHLEPWSDWHTALYPWAEPFLHRPLSAKLRNAQRLVAGLNVEPRGYFGPTLTPGQMLIGRRVGMEGEKMVLATAALRAQGVPARVQPDWDGVEYHDGRTWRFWPVLDHHVREHGTLRISPRETRPARDFGVARIDAEGFLKTLDDLPWIQTAHGWECVLPVGTYTLLEARRGQQHVTVRLRRLEITPRQTATITLQAAHPEKTDP